MIKDMLKRFQQIDGTIDEGLDYISMPLNDNIKNVYPNLTI